MVRVRVRVRIGAGVGVRVLVCPHVAPGGGGPGGGQRVVRDPLGTVSEGQLAVRRIHDLQRQDGVE
eukprot:scaffold2621_cov64-Phaeocystis_antarctica.AAC.11